MDEEQKGKITVRALCKAKKNLVNFRSIVLPCGDDEVEPPRFHFDWSDSLLHGVENEAIEGFRESGKTQIVLRSFPAYNLTFPYKSRDYVVIIKNNSTLAKAKLKEIEAEFETNPIVSSRAVKVHEQSGEVFSVDVLDDNDEVINIRTEAYGKGASIRGLANRDRRPKIIICDDLQDLEDAKSETVQKTDWEWFLSDVYFLGQKSRVFLIGNNLGERCILERVFLNKRHLGYHTKRIKAITPDGRSAWASKYSIEEIQAQKASFTAMGKLTIWLREKMCEAVGEETRIFKEEYYHHYSPQLAKKITESCNMWATLDPASSKDKDSCFRAFCINAVDVDNKWNIVDFPFGRWDSAELLDIMFDKVVQWNLKNVGIEKGMYKQVFEPFLDKEMARRNVFFHVIPIEHAKYGTKLERIKMLQPRFKAGLIWFPDHGKWSEDKKIITEDWVVELKAELAGVTKDEIKSMYIDLADCLAMQEQIAKKPYGRSQTARSLPRQTESNFNVLGTRQKQTQTQSGFNALR